MNSKTIGSGFESDFLKLCQLQGIAITRIPDSCRALGKNRLIQIASPFDWILTWGGRSTFIDTKTVSGESFPHSKITEHQVIELLKHEEAGARAGYLVWFRNTQIVIFIPAGYLYRCMSKRGSISEQSTEILNLGCIDSLKLQKLFFACPLKTFL